MARLLKTLLLAVAGIVLLAVLSAVAISFLVDPNDFRDDIERAVKDTTGRDLTIEGDLDFSLFPWLALEVGRTRLGNAAGFGDEPFAEFESARLSVRLMPLLLRRELAVGTAELDSLRLALAVNRQGRSNWEDLLEAGAEPDVSTPDTAGEGPAGLDIASVVVRGAALSLDDRQAGSSLALDNVSLETGRISLGQPFALAGSFDYRLQPAAIDGRMTFDATVSLAEEFDAVMLAGLALETKANGVAEVPVAVEIRSDSLRANLAESRIEPTKLAVRVLDIAIDADIEALSWANGPSGRAALDVAAFSPRTLMQRLGIEPPPTNDPQALGSARLTAKAAMDGNGIGMRDVRLKLDDTTLTGQLFKPASDGPLTFDLAADKVVLDRYMAPAVGAGSDAAEAEAADFEIPAELIRALNLRGEVRLARATFANMEFTNMTAGIDGRSGKLRLQPLSAELFNGRYAGDVKIDASGKTPALAMNERIEGVSLQPLAKAMFERDNITGGIDGSFALNARGERLSVMRENLNGTMTFQLKDGTWEGVDLWYQLRRARALYRQEVPPEPRNPPRTQFSSVVASGKVTNGVFENNDLLAEMPHLQLTGRGTVNLVKGEIDYALQARVLERPEFMRNASEQELKEFTRALIPVRVRGTLAEPTVRPDIEAMFKRQVDDALEKKKDELKNRLLDRLVPRPPQGQPPADGQPPAEGEAPAGEQPVEEKPKDPEDVVKDRLKKLFGH